MRFSQRKSWIWDGTEDCHRQSLQHCQPRHRQLGRKRLPGLHWRPGGVSLPKEQSGPDTAGIREPRGGLGHPDLGQPQHCLAQHWGQKVSVQLGGRAGVPCRLQLHLLRHWVRPRQGRTDYSSQRLIICWRLCKMWAVFPGTCHRTGAFQSADPGKLLSSRKSWEDLSVRITPSPAASLTASLSSIPTLSLRSVSQSPEFSLLPLVPAGQVQTLRPAKPELLPSLLS